MLPNMTGDCSPQMFALNVPGFILHLHFKHVAVKQTKDGVIGFTNSHTLHMSHVKLLLKYA